MFTTAGAEGATAPETLRLKDRVLMGLWKVGVAFGYCPTEDESRVRHMIVHPVNLSGTETEGAPILSA